MCLALCDFNTPWRYPLVHSVIQPMCPCCYASCDHSASAVINYHVTFRVFPTITPLQDLLVRAFVCHVVDKAHFTKAPCLPCTTFTDRHLHLSHPRTGLIVRKGNRPRSEANDTFQFWNHLPVITPSLLRNTASSPLGAPPQHAIRTTIIHAST